MTAGTSDTTVRLGVIGGGIWGTHHLSAARELERWGLVEIVGVATRTQASADRQAEAFDITGWTDWERMLDEEEPDAVTVATPDHLHREMVLGALERDCHVLVEKPMDLTVVGCEEMVETAAERDRLLAVDFHKRYDPHVIDLREQVADGAIGELQYAYAYMEDQIIVPTEWLAGWAAESSPFWFLGVHKYDLLRWVTGRDAVSVLAHGSRQKLAGQGIDTWDSVRAHVELEGGATATIHAAWILPRSFEAVVNQGVRLVGSDGVAEMDEQDRGLRYYRADEASASTANPLTHQDRSGPRGPAVSGYFVDPIKDFLENVAHVLDGAPTADLAGHYPAAVDGLRATQLAAAVDRSLAEGGIVEVPR